MIARGILAGILWLAGTVTSSLAAEHTVVRTHREAVVEMRVAALIMSGQQGGALPIALAILPGVDDPESFTAMVEIDGAALLDSLLADGVAEDGTDEDGTDEDRPITGRESAAIRSVAGPLVVDLFAYVLGDQLDVLDQQSVSLELDAVAHGEVLAATGLKFFVPLALTANAVDGPRQLRVLARVGKTFGLRGTEVKGMSGDPPQAWPPAFAEFDEPWLIAMPQGEVVLPPPFGFGAGAVLPTSRALIVAGEPMLGQAFAAPLPGSRLIALVRSPGDAAVVWPLEIGEREQVRSVTPFDATPFTVENADLDPGLYEIALAWGPDSDELPDATKARASSSYVPVFIASPARTDARDLDRGVEQPELSPETRTKKRRPPNRKLKELLARIATDYLSALRQLVAGERRAALATLSASETGVVEQLNADAVPILAAGQTSALASLTDSEWRAVLPAALLHLDLSQRYRRQHRFILTHHATQRVVELARAAATRLATPEASVEAARTLAGLGSQYQLTGSLSQAKKLFDQALDLADDATALLGLATLQEKRGHFVEAVPALERLVTVQSEFPEGRLRLALNRIRTGRIKPARDDLRRLARQTDSDWVAVVAHQELARLEVERSDSRAAVKLLRRGLQRWPGHPTLAIQLAYVLESQGQGRASLELLTETRFASATAEFAARERSRYNAWSEQLPKANRHQLDLLAETRLADLGRWLAAQPGATPVGTNPAGTTPAGTTPSGGAAGGDGGR